MATIIKRGDATIVQGPIIYRNNPNVGDGSTQTSFEGDYDAIVIEAGIYSAAGWVTEIIRNGPSIGGTDNYAVLNCTFNKDISQVDKTPTVVWEIQEHPVEQNILEATDRPIVANLSTKTKQLIEYN